MRGETVVLRPAHSDDVAARLEPGSDPEIHRMVGGSRDRLRPVSPDGAARWVDRLTQHPHAWVIERGTPIGEIRLDRVDTVDRRAALAIGILDPAALGMGYGTEAARLLLCHAFTTLGLHRVSVRVLAYNARAIRCYTKCGFVEEGREREAALVDGVWHDDLIMGVLDREFRCGPTRNADS